MEAKDPRVYSLFDMQHLGTSRFHKFARDYFNAGANDEFTLKSERAAFDRIKLKQRTFVDKSKFKGTETMIMDRVIASPICVTSTAFQRMANPEGEIATARACNNFNETPIVMSSWATSTNEDFGAACPDSYKIFQIYLSTIPDVNLDIWKRIKKSGFKAVALTTDTQLLGKRHNDTRNRFQLPYPWKMGNFAKYENQGQKTDLAHQSEGSGLANFAKHHKANDIDWSIIKYIKANSDGLLVFAKGIMCAEDARLALEAGYDGLYVSNHGARQLDTTPATIEVLREISEEAEKFARETNTPKRPVFFDGGVRTGADVLKALALGADLVWIGRPILWALSIGGQRGVENLLRILNEEFKEAMLQCGCMSIADIKSKNIIYADDELVFPKL